MSVDRSRFKSGTRPLLYPFRCGDQSGSRSGKAARQTGEMKWFLEHFASNLYHFCQATWTISLNIAYYLCQIIDLHVAAVITWRRSSQTTATEPHAPYPTAVIFRSRSQAALWKMESRVCERPGLRPCDGREEKELGNFSCHTGPLVRLSWRDEVRKMRRSPVKICSLCKQSSNEAHCCHFRAGCCSL